MPGEFLLVWGLFTAQNVFNFFKHEITTFYALAKRNPEIEKNDGPIFLCCKCPGTMLDFQTLEDP